jgi:hypothetical protein
MSGVGGGQGLIVGGRRLGLLVRNRSARMGIDLAGGRSWYRESYSRPAGVFPAFESGVFGCF